MLTFSYVTRLVGCVGRTPYTISLLKIICVFSFYVLIAYSDLRWSHHIVDLGVGDKGHACLVCLLELCFLNSCFLLLLLLLLLLLMKSFIFL